MPGCFVPNCTSGYRCCTEKVALFRPPSDPKLLDLWRKKIPRKDRKLEYSDRICERHFTNEDIIRYFETKLSDGTIERIPRDRLLLKEGSIPSQYPNCPSYLTSVVKKRKSPKKREIISPKKRKIAKEPPDNAESVITPPAVQQDIDDASSLITEGEIRYQPVSICKETFDTRGLPSCWTYSTLPNNGISFLHWSENYNSILRRLVIHDGGESEVFVLERKVLLPLKTSQLVTYDDLISMLKKIEEIKICKSKTQSMSTLKGTNKECRCFVSVNSTDAFCSNCKVPPSKPRSKMKLRTIRNKLYRFQKKYKIMKHMVKLQAQAANTDTNKLNEQIAKLPMEQRENVLACFQAAKVGNKKGIRYTSAWIYQCVLLKIKSNSVYQYLRRHNILQLPCVNTIYRYLKNLKPMYGFQTATFDAMKKKSESMPIDERRGVILIDEMKLTPYLSLDKESLMINGFVDLGKYTPEEQRNQPGDHGLVLLYQPFKGRWVQPVAAFLSKGAASGYVLTQILIEAVVLLENSNFLVDAIVCDGATWNRSMWRQFGATPEQPWCVHITDDDRKLFFVSDFPHLIKNLRNWVLKEQKFRNSDGIIDLNDWKALIAYDDSNHGAFGIKLCPRLTQDHINLKHYNKMNVAKAYQFFGEDVVAALEVLNQKNLLISEEGTRKFCRRIQRLIRAMSSRCRKGALWPNSTEHEDITDFLAYLKEWRTTCKEIGKRQKEATKNLDQNADDSLDIAFMTENTCDGLLATLTATLEIFKYLVENCEFKFLMTTRLNQDNLERFFGMIRAHGGNADHPTSLMFIQIYRLLSCYSLIRTCKGSNVEGTGQEIFDTLTKISDLKKQPNDKKEHWTFLLDRVIDTGVDMSEFTWVFEDNMDAMEYFAGYVARKSSKYTKCEMCINSVKRIYQNPTEFSYLQCRNYCKGLVLPSEEIIQLCNVIETSLRDVNVAEMKTDTLYDVVSDIVENKEIPLLGCSDYNHKTSFTLKILNFILVTRMLFACKVANKKNNSEYTKCLRKTGKY